MTESSTAMLQPYQGVRDKEHLGPDGAGVHTRDTYGPDKSGKTTYSFNSLGFRGEEFDPDAPVKLFVAGCSYTLGTGLDIEQSWAHLFKQKLAEHRGLPQSSVNLMNFSFDGASNDYITRILIEQSARVRPDVIVAGFTRMSRFELMDETTPFYFQPGQLDQPRQLEDYARAGGKLAEMARLAEFLFLGTDDNQVKLRMLKNILLLQYFCQHRDIALVFFLFESLLRDDLPSALSIPMTEALFEEVDFRLLIRTDPGTKVDVGNDLGYPGPHSQELMAAAAIETFRARYP